MKRKIRIMLVDDHEALLHGMESYLRNSGKFTVVGRANSGPVFWKHFRKLSTKPDIVLLDLSMPVGESGIEVLGKLKKKASEVRVVIFTVNRSYIKKCKDLKADGIALKSDSLDNIIKGLVQVADGNYWESEEVGQMLSVKEMREEIERDYPLALARLTESEILVLKNIEGNSKVIADRLGKSHRTVHKQIENIKLKLGLNSKESLVKFAIRAGLLN